MSRLSLVVVLATPFFWGAGVWMARADAPLVPSPGAATEPGTKIVDVVFSGGYQTVGRDRGRPVILIAAALGVPADVFREAFSHVKPAPAGTEPDPEQVRKNKQALMDALAPYGVTDERLNEVSNYYRYDRSRGEMWRNDPALGHAVVKDGKVVSLVVTHAGNGYSSVPEVNLPGFAGASIGAKVAYTKVFATNGAITSLELVRPTSP